MKSAQLERLLEFLRFPSVSTDPARKGAVADCALWLAAELRVIGLSAEVHPTAGHPVVVGRNEHQSGRPTVMIYGHYDVQPVDEPERPAGGAAGPDKHRLTPPVEARGGEDVVFAPR